MRNKPTMKRESILLPVMPLPELKLFLPELQSEITEPK